MPTGDTKSGGTEVSIRVTVTVWIPLDPTAAEFVDADTATGELVVERDRYITPGEPQFWKRGRR